MTKVPDYMVRWDFRDGRLIFEAGAEGVVTEKVARVTNRVPVVFRGVHRGGATASHPFTWGGGARGRGPVMPFAGSVVAASLSVSGFDQSGTVTCQLGRNGLAAGKCYQLSVTGEGKVSCIYDLAEPLTFRAGDDINFINVGSSITGAVVVTADVLVIFSSRP